VLRSTGRRSTPERGLPAAMARSPMCERTSRPRLESRSGRRQNAQGPTALDRRPHLAPEPRPGRTPKTVGPTTSDPTSRPAPEAMAGWPKRPVRPAGRPRKSPAVAARVSQAEDRPSLLHHARGERAPGAPPAPFPALPAPAPAPPARGAARRPRTGLRVPPPAPSGPAPPAPSPSTGVRSRSARGSARGRRAAGDRTRTTSPANGGG